MKHFLLACTLFLSISASATSNPDISNIPAFELNFEDEKIFESHNNPDKIAEIKHICNNIEIDKFYNSSILCSAWNISKKLSDKQTNLLFYVKFLLTRLVFDSSPLCVSMEYLIMYDFEFRLQFLTRIENILSGSQMAECAYESVTRPINSVFSKPCNIDSELIKMCENEKDVITCMRQNLIDELPKLALTDKIDDALKRVRPDKKETVFHDITELTQKTELFIQSIIPDKTEQEHQIKRLYNFYWIFIHELHNGVLSYIAKNKDSACFD